MNWNVFDAWDDPFGWTGSVARRSRLSGAGFPRLNVHGNEEELLVVGEIPGLNSDDLDITVKGRSLTLKGSRKIVELGEDENYSHRERTGGEFSRALTLPFEVDPDKVSANYENGTLSIHLPRTEKDKPRKIEVKVA